VAHTSGEFIEIAELNTAVASFERIARQLLLM